MDAKKLIKQCGRNRFLQTLAYLASFPLLIICVFVGSVSFMGEGAFGNTQYYGVIVCALAWLVVTLFQIIVAIITKNHAARAVIVVIVTLIIMAGGAFVFDMWAEGKVDDARIAYVRDVNGLDDEVKVTVDAKGYSYVHTMPSAGNAGSGPAFISSTLYTASGINPFSLVEKKVVRPLYFRQ